MNLSRIHHVSAVVLMLSGGAGLLAQPARPGAPDSASVYRLGEVVVTADTLGRVMPVTIDRIGLAKIDRTDASTVSEVVYQIPSARIQTNSRGESLLYMRSAGERQVALFFNGALLNVPWDNRVDLSLVPVSAAGGIEVSRGTPSVLYGMNVLGGAVNISSQELRLPGNLTEVVAQAGEHSLVSSSVMHLGRTGNFSYTGSISYASRDGYGLPGDAGLEFNQTDREVRTNTDHRSMGLFAGGTYRFSGNASLGLSVHHIDAEKGVAPEGHVPDGARYWRYPDWRNTTVSLNGSALFGEEGEWSLRGAIWGTGFSQTISQFTSMEYTTLEAQQEDDDFTMGTRLILSRTLGDGRLNLALNGLQSSHEQRDLAFDSLGVLVPYTDSTGAETSYPVAEYQQRNYSVGLEYEGRVVDRLGIMVGVSLDGIATPKTGDKPERDPLSDYSAMIGATYDLSDAFTLRGSVGRKTRFATLRELFGEALRRFLVNPDLKPEESVIGELGADLRLDGGRIGIVGFTNSTSNTIDQRNVQTQSGTKRQRINLPGSFGYGVELTGALTALNPFYLDGHVSYLYARGRGTAADGSDTTFVLAEKPEMLATITAEYRFDFGLHPSVEIVHLGQAYSPNTDNVFVPLDPSTSINIRLAYRLTLTSVTENSAAELFIRVNNLTDELVLPQLGLPAPGREILGGIKFTL